MTTEKKSTKPILNSKKAAEKAGKKKNLSKALRENLLRRKKDASNSI
jgi:hypothetical protein